MPLLKRRNQTTKLHLGNRLSVPGGNVALPSSKTSCTQEPTGQTSLKSYLSSVFLLSLLFYFLALHLKMSLWLPKCSFPYECPCVLMCFLNVCDANLLLRHSHVLGWERQGYPPPRAFNKEKRSKWCQFEVLSSGFFLFISIILLFYSPWFRDSWVKLVSRLLYSCRLISAFVYWGLVCCCCVFKC